MRKENRIAKFQTPPRSTTPRAGEQPIAAVRQVCLPSRRVVDQVGADADWPVCIHSGGGRAVASHKSGSPGRRRANRGRRRRCLSKMSCCASAWIGKMEDCWHWRMLPCEAQSRGRWKISRRTLAIELSRDGRKTVLQPEQAAAFRCETASPDQNRLRLTWEDFSSLDAAGLRVEVVAELEGGEPVSRWGISVDKPAAVGLEEIRFPRLVRSPPAGGATCRSRLDGTAVGRSAKDARRHGGRRGAGSPGIIPACSLQCWPTTRTADAASRRRATTRPPAARRLLFGGRPAATCTTR